MSVMNGSDILLIDSESGFPLACQKNVTIAMKDNMIDATCKQSGGYMVNMAGKREFSFTCEALVDFDAGASQIGISTLFDAYTDRTLISLCMFNDILDVPYYTGLVYVDSIEVNAPMEDVTTYTATFTGTFDIIE